MECVRSSKLCCGEHCSSQVCCDSQFVIVNLLSPFVSSVNPILFFLLIQSLSILCSQQIEMQESDTFHIQNEKYSYLLTLTTSSSSIILEIEKEDSSQLWKAVFSP